jgi:hypothetical protein
MISLKKKQFLASQCNSYIKLAKIVVLDVAKLSLKGS